MAKVFISFLGTGNPNVKADQPGYDVLTYRFENNEQAYTSRFAQRAIIEKHGPASFERICLMMTPESKAKHRDLLVTELLSIGCIENQLIEDASITTNQSTEQQWEWFDSLQRLIHDGDEVVFDFTHGFRSVPIIFSTAISFLQKVKRFTLLNAHYGYMVDKKLATGEIIDMAKFYRINEWADGVARLVDMADASKLAALADEGLADGFAALNDPKLTQALRELTDLIKNIDVNNVGKKADEALKLITRKQQQCSGADAQLLQMVVDKFESLAIEGSGRYDHDYFWLQLILAEMLLKHGLNMQAFTVMRECIASIGMLAATGKYAKKKLTTNEGRRYRKNIGEIFWGLCITEREKWIQEIQPEKVPKSELAYFNEMVLPFYEKLDTNNIIKRIQPVAKSIQIYRNGLNHAWTNDKEAPTDIAEQGRHFLQQLTGTIELLKEHNLLD